MRYDVTILTDPRYESPTKDNPYIKNVLLEDQLVREALEAYGLKVTRVSWDNPDFDWASTKYAIFRTVWDYFDRIKEFKKWYKETALKTKFINTKLLIDWNIDKHYLLDLKEKGIHIPRTQIIEAGDQITLKEVVENSKKHHGFLGEEFVIKPCIAGGARETYKFNIANITAYEAIFKRLIENEAMILQEFQQHIVKEGEISMMVMNGQFTHAVLKKAKEGDFRVQDDWGGTVHKYKPTKEEINFAELAIKASPELPFYGRADIFKDNDGKIALAELEIFEPELWFRFFPEAAQKLAKGIKQNLFE